MSLKNDFDGFVLFMSLTAICVFGVVGLGMKACGGGVSVEDQCEARCSIRRHKLIEGVCHCANIDGWEKPKAEELHP